MIEQFGIADIIRSKAVRDHYVMILEHIETKYDNYYIYLVLQEGCTFDGRLDPLYWDKVA